MSRKLYTKNPMQYILWQSLKMNHYILCYYLFWFYILIFLFFWHFNESENSTTTINGSLNASLYGPLKNNRVFSGLRSYLCDVFGDVFIPPPGTGRWLKAVSGIINFFKPALGATCDADGRNRQRRKKEHNQFVCSFHIALLFYL
jgi:hypothetical protein